MIIRNAFALALATLALSASSAFASTPTYRYVDALTGNDVSIKQGGWSSEESMGAFKFDLRVRTAKGAPVFSDELFYETTEETPDSVIELEIGKGATVPFYRNNDSHFSKGAAVLIGRGSEKYTLVAGSSVTYADLELIDPAIDTEYATLPTCFTIGLAGAPTAERAQKQVYYPVNGPLAVACADGKSDSGVEIRRDSRGKWTVRFEDQAWKTETIRSFGDSSAAHALLAVSPNGKNAAYFTISAEGVVTQLAGGYTLALRRK